MDISRSCSIRFSANGCDAPFPSMSRSRAILSCRPTQAGSPIEVGRSTSRATTWPERPIGAAKGRRGSARSSSALNRNSRAASRDRSRRRSSRRKDCIRRISSSPRFLGSRRRGPGERSSPRSEPSTPRWGREHCPCRSSSLEDPTRRASYGNLRSRSEGPCASRDWMMHPRDAPLGSGADLRPKVREPVHGVILEAGSVRQEKFPDLLEVLDREDTLPLPPAPQEDLSVLAFLEMIRQRGFRNSDRGLELPERPLPEEQQFEDDLPRHILPEHRENSPLGLDERTGNEVPLAVSVLLGFQDPIPFQVPEVVREHARRHPEHLSDPTEVDTGVRRQEVVDPATAFEFESFRHHITSAARGTGPRAPRGSGQAILSRRMRRSSWRSR